MMNTIKIYVHNSVLMYIKPERSDVKERSHGCREKYNRNPV